MSYLPNEYYPPTYFPMDYFTPIIVSAKLEKQFIFVIQTQMDKNLGISIQMDQSLEVNRKLEISVNQ